MIASADFMHPTGLTAGITPGVLRAVISKARRGAPAEAAS
jgi:hypothetical protein